MTLKHRGFEASVQCGGQQLEEFAVKIEDEKTASCWIASEAGKIFEIVMHSEIDHVIAAKCHVDGRRIDSGFLEVGQTYTSQGLKIRGRDQVRPYMFVPLTVTDDDTIANPKDSSLRDLGTVEIRVFRAVIGDPVKVAPASDNRITEMAVHEKTKKVGIHRVTLANPIPRKALQIHDWTYVDPRHSPYVTLKFRYRPRDLLLAKGIITAVGPPDDPSVSPPDHARSSQDSDSDVVIVEEPTAGFSSRKRRREEAQMNAIDVDGPSTDGDSDDSDEVLDNISAIETQLLSLTQQLRHAKRKQIRKSKKMRVKEELEP